MQAGRAELRALIVVSTICLLLLIALRVFAAPRINTEVVTLTQNTPRSIGNPSGRGLLTIRNLDSTNAIKCGPLDEPNSEWVELAAKGLVGDAVQFGIVYRGQFSAEAVIQCINTAATANVQYVEEGNVPQVTPTP